MRTLEKAAAMVVGDAIRTARLRKGLTLRELAEAIGVAIASLREYEVGRTLPGEARRAMIADVLGVPASRFGEPHLADLTPDERDLLAAYKRISTGSGKAHVIRVMAAIEHGREVSAC